MKQKLICLAAAALMLFAFAGCTEQANISGGPAAAPGGREVEARGSAAPGAGQGELESSESPGSPESTTVIGQSAAEEPAATAAPEFTYSETYEGDGYSFRYPKGTQTLKDTETAKTFQLPDGYILNVTRLNLSGQDIKLDETLEVYQKTLEEQGSVVEKVEKPAGYPYENALIELELKSGSEKSAAVQAFFLADECNYTFTVSAKDGEMEILKKVVGDIAKTFTVK